MTIKEVMTAIENEYKSIFPQSASYVRNGALSSGDNEAHHLTTYLGNKSTFTNGISGNDQMSMTFWIFAPMNEDGKFILEISASGSGVSINPSNPIFVMETLHIPFRKKTMTAEKLIVAMRKQFMKMHNVVCENADNIYNNQKLKECGII